MLRPLSLALLTTLLACGPGKDDGDTDADTSTTTGAPDATATDTTTTGVDATATSTADTASTGADTATTAADTTTTATTSADTTTSTSTTTGADTTAGSTTGSTTGASLCDNDKYEPNDLPESAAVVPWDEETQYASYVTIDGFLCSGEGDWYHVAAGSLNYRFHALHLDGIVEGSSWCGAGCDQPWLPDAPENTLQIDVHDAETLQLLGTQTAADGRVDLGGSGDAYAKDLLIHVHADLLEATYAYMLTIEIRGYDGEDECEC